MNMPENQIYFFADVEVDASRGCLKRGGEERHLRQKTFQVLLYLIKHRGNNITKEELLKDIWKDTAVVDDVLVQSIKDIRRIIGDNPRHPHFIRTIPKVGYRFIGEVQSQKSKDAHPIKETEEQAPEIKVKNRNSKSPSRTRVILLLILSIVLMYVVFSIAGQTLRQDKNTGVPVLLPNEPGKKSLAIMFFENQSNDVQLDWLREGLTDMLIVDLSRSEKFQVLSRDQLHIVLERRKMDRSQKIGLNEAFEIARRTEAELVLTGSFARLGEKMRIDVHLYDVRSGQLRATESLIVEKPEQILTEIKLLSLKLANRPGAEETLQEKAADLSETMTNDLKAYRYYSLGVEQAQGFHNKEAIELFEKAIMLDPKFAMAHARIGYAYAVTWDFKEKGKPYLEKAYQLSERLSEKDRLNIAAWYAIANFDFPEAIEKFRRLIAKYPLEMEAYQYLARLLKGEGQLEEAINVLKLGLAIDPEAKNLYNSLGYTLSYLGRHEEAIAAHQRYVALAPSEPNTYDSLGMTYQWSGDYESAIATYNHALALNPKFDIAIVHLANTYFQTGQYKRAIELYRQYIKNAPSNLERGRGYESIILVYLKKQDYDSAEKAAKELSKLQKSWVWSSYFIALERGNSALAKQLEKQIFTNPDNTNRGGKNSLRPELYRRGYIALKNGFSNEAIANFQEAVRQLPQTWNIDAYEDCLANAYSKLDRFDEAVAEYGRVLRLNPNYPLAYFHLAQNYERRGMNDKARESYERFLKIWQNADSDIPDVIAAQRFLANK